MLLWLQTATLFTFQALTTYALARGEVGLTPVVSVGAALMVVGLVVEAVADRQKQAAKHADAQAWVSTGVFARSRHPNYAAEIVVQTGLVVCAVGAALATGSWGWAFAGLVLSPVYIVLLMLSATTGAELAQAGEVRRRPGVPGLRRAQRCAAAAPGLSPTSLRAGRARAGRRRSRRSRASGTSAA